MVREQRAAPQKVLTLKANVRKPPVNTAPILAWMPKKTTNFIGSTRKQQYNHVNHTRNEGM